MRDLEQSGAMLSKKEFDVINTRKSIEHKQLAIKSAEDNAMFQKISAAAMHREVSKLHNAEFRATVGSRVSSSRAPLPLRSRHGSVDSTALNLGPTKHLSAAFDDSNKKLENELRSIQQSIRCSKQSLNKNATARVATFGFLSDEVNYMSNSGNIAMGSYY